MIHLQSVHWPWTVANPCYEASNVKPTEAQEAVHVYETVKHHN